MLRFLWNSTRGHRIAPWRSPYLLWRIETFTGVKMTQIGFLEFWGFLWTERDQLVALPEVDSGNGPLRSSQGEESLGIRVPSKRFHYHIHFTPLTRAQ